jgi:uncharacterized glyoxalase superfamily protein PhnB
MMGGASEKFPANKLLVHIYVPDSDATYKRAIDAGCKPMETPKEQEGDPDRRGMFEDFSGNIWSVSTQVRKE